MPVFREVEFTFNGKDYEFVPSNRIMRKIESELSPSSAMGILTKLSTGSPPLFELAYLATAFVQAAGGMMDEDRAFKVLQKDVLKSGDQLTSLVEALAKCLGIDGEDEGKKPEPEEQESQNP